MPKIIEIRICLFKLQLKMSGVFFLRHSVYFNSVVKCINLLTLVETGYQNSFLCSDNTPFDDSQRPYILPLLF